MNPGEPKNTASPLAAPPESEETGVPGLRTWAKIYWLVTGLFVVVVGLLVALSRMFS